jgi:hypothetical protein
MGAAKRRRSLSVAEGGPPVQRGQTPQAGTFRIENPLVIMFADPQGEVVCHIHPSERCPTHESYGLLVADLVRHVARAFYR